MVAKYMGGFIAKSITSSICIEINPPIKNQLWYNIDSELKYDSSWEWLMPVVEKIEKESIFSVQSIYDKREEFKGWIPELFTLRVKDDIKGIGLDELRFSTKIEATYKAVIEFIKWYNEKNL